MSEERRCGTCSNWFPGKSAMTAEVGAELGECHRYAPRPSLDKASMSEAYRVVWPQTQANEVCGEWYWGGLRAPKASEKPVSVSAETSAPPMAEPVRSA